tara:strand:+ start:4637 stop:5029 length:393 start_codon:yes stop_codon:yes gene_type:complete
MKNKKKNDSLITRVLKYFTVGILGTALGAAAGLKIANELLEHKNADREIVLESSYLDPQTNQTTYRKASYRKVDGQWKRVKGDDIPFGTFFVGFHDSIKYASSGFALGGAGGATLSLAGCYGFRKWKRRR